MQKIGSMGLTRVQNLFSTAFVCHRTSRTNCTCQWFDVTLILIIKFAIDCLDCPWAIWTIELSIGNYDFGTIFFLKNVKGIIIIVT
jgi:hypothetical protein